jgi:general secretion pathway protein B
VAQKHAHTRSEPKPEAVKPSAKTETKLAKAAAPSKRTLPGTYAADAGPESKPSEKAAKTAKTAGDEAPRIHALSELPAEIRQQIPPLTIGGASYSSNPSSRMLIVNGQVFHENDRLTPDLQLQQIRLKSAVLDFKGHRYEIKY